MKQFKIKIEKINRKWAEIKVQSKKDNEVWYRAKVLKDNLLSVIPSADTNEYDVDVYGNMETISDRFKTEHILEICAVAYLKSSNEEINGAFTSLMLKQSVENLRAFREVCADETCYDEEIAQISNEIAEKYFEDFKREHKQGRNWTNGWFNEETADIIQNVCLVHDYDDYIEKVRQSAAENTFNSLVIAYEKENCIRKNYVARLKEIGCYDKYSSKIEEMQKEIEAHKQQERIEAERKRAELEAQPKKFFYYRAKKNVGEVFQEGNFYYRVTKVTEKCTVFDDDGIKMEGSRYDYAILHEFDTMNYEYQYDYTYRHDVEVISKEEYETLKAIQDAEKEQKRLQKEAEEIKEKNITEKLNSLVYYINHEMTLITEDTNRSELESNSVFFEFSEYEIILAKHKIFVVETEANINLLEESHIHDIRGYCYRGYEASYKSKFLENLKEFFKLTENANAISVIDTAIANNDDERVEYMQTLELEEKSVQSTAQTEKSLDEATKIIKNTLNDIKTSYIQLGSVLYQVNTEKLYKQKYRTFAEYCTTELDIKKRQAYAYINVFEKYGSDERLANYSFTQLQLLADNSKSVDEILVDYPCTLSTRDLKKKIKEKSVQSTAQNKSSTKNFSITADENALLVKALELLQQQEENANIQNLLKKLKG